METPRNSYVIPLKVAALVFLCLTPLLTNLSYFRAILSVDLNVVGRDQITVEEERFEEVRKVLPPGSIVGYVSDETDVDQATRKYYLTQYAIAPLIVVRGLDRPLIVGDFSGAEKPTSLENRTLIKDFGKGVLLFGPNKE